MRFKAHLAWFYLKDREVESPPPIQAMFGMEIILQQNASNRNCQFYNWAYVGGSFNSKRAS